MQGLDRPARTTEFRGQIIQQLRMAWSLSPEAEIVGRGHQAATHVLLPNPINHHSRRKRIGRVG